MAALRTSFAPWPTWSLVLLFGLAPLAVAVTAHTRHRRAVGAATGVLGIMLTAAGVRTAVTTDALHLITMDFPVEQVLTNAATVFAPLALVAIGLVLVLTGVSGVLGDRVLGGTATAAGVLIGVLVAGALLALAFQPLLYRGGTVQAAPIWAALVTGLAALLLIVVVTRWWSAAAGPAAVAEPAAAGPAAPARQLSASTRSRRVAVRWGALVLSLAVVAGAALWSRDRVGDRLALPELFADPSLAGCVAAALGVPAGEQVSERDLSGVIELSCTGDLLAGGPISSLAGIDALPGLSGLELSNNAVADLGPLTGLPQLRTLSLNANQVSDLSPLAGLPQLTELGLFGNQVSDLAPLTGLTSLTGLDLTNNQVADLAPLTGLTGLESLGLHGNQVTDLTPLAGLTSLDSVGLSQNPVADPSPLCRLPGLTHLDLTFDQVTDAGTLTGCAALEQLNLGANPLTDLTPLLALPSLLGVDLSETDASGISGIEELRAAGIHVGGLAG